MQHDISDIALNYFVLRQTPNSDFTHWTISYAELVSRILRGKINPGYRDGVLLVEIDPDGFFCPVKTLQDGDVLCGSYSARVPGEEPRKHIRCLGQKIPAARVDVVLYHKDVLAENNENTSDATWEVVSVNSALTNEMPPIHPDTLIANHFQLDGGTQTNMNDSDFVAALRNSVAYWKNKALIKV